VMERESRFARDICNMPEPIIRGRWALVQNLPFAIQRTEKGQPSRSPRQGTQYQTIIHCMGLLRSCPECQSIFLELLKASHDVSKQGREQQTETRPLIAWLEQLNEEECARTRETSRLWAARRRQEEHRALTGHYLPVPLLPPGMSSNPN